MNPRFHELLPWYVNGTLGADDRAWMEAYLAENATARAELAWMQTLGEEVRRSAPQVPPTLGLAQTLTRIRAERPSAARRLARWLQALVPWQGASGGLRPAWGLAMAAVIVVQVAVIGRLLPAAGDESQQVRSGTTRPAPDGPVLKLSFNADAREADIRFALLAVRGTLVGGPGQLGSYYVRVPAGQHAAAAAQLKDQPGVRSVEIVPAVPVAP